MRNMILAVCLAAAVVGYGGSTTVYRDASGRVTATTVVDGNGKTTWRDGLGRIQGSRTTDRSGKTTYRDALGRVQGSQTTDSRGKTTYRDASGRVRGTVTTDSNGKTTDIRLEHTQPTLDSYPKTNFFSDPDVEKVLLVEKLLSGCDKLDISILREVLNRESYSKIAAKLFIAENTISYRIKKILSLAPDKTKDEIFSLLAQFLF